MPRQKEMRTRRQAKCASAEKQHHSITHYAGGVFLALSITGILPACVCSMLGVG